jgi:hypothetical protein
LLCFDQWFMSSKQKTLRRAPRRTRIAGTGRAQKRGGGSSPPTCRQSSHGRPVNRPPMKKLKPSTQSQCGQEYMTSFFTLPTTSLRSGRESEEAAFSFRVTGFLQ